MLSYQHAYHAGNLADVQKHALLAWTLARLTEKDKPFTYIETHAGRGLYDLSAPEAVKTGEAEAGIGRALREGWFAGDHPYLRALGAVRAAHGAQAYPGSPLIAASLLRPDDRMHLAELHPAEHAALAGLMRGRASVHRQDGFALALSLTPPEPRRGVLVIDPSYEVKADYAAIPGQIGKLHAKWNVGVIVLWFPVLAAGLHRGMLAALARAGLPRFEVHEVAFPPARPGHGMTGSGIAVVNAPFGLADEAARLAERFAGLQAQTGRDRAGPDRTARNGRGR